MSDNTNSTGDGDRPKTERYTVDTAQQTTLLERLSKHLSPDDSTELLFVPAARYYELVKIQEPWMRPRYEARGLMWRGGVTTGLLLALESLDEPVVFYTTGRRCAHLVTEAIRKNNLVSVQLYSPDSSPPVCHVRCLEDAKKKRCHSDSWGNTRFAIIDSLYSGAGIESSIRFVHESLFPKSRKIVVVVDIKENADLSTTERKTHHRLTCHDLIQCAQDCGLSCDIFTDFYDIPGPTKKEFSQ